MFDVPLRIPDLVLETIPEETGFTISEKIALRNAWRLIADYKDEYSKDMFITFFTEHPTSLEKFRDENGELNMENIHSHPGAVFQTLEAIIFEGIEGTTQMRGILFWVACGHIKKLVGKELIELLLGDLGKYLKTVLQRVLSPTLETSIDKICDIIAEAHSENKEK